MNQSGQGGGGRPPRGEGLRRALRWLSDEGRHDAAAVEEACRRFDLSPADEEFLLRETRRTDPGSPVASGGLRPTRPPTHRRIQGRDGETICRPAETDEFPSLENVGILESWNTAADPELSVARARLAPGRATEPHLLETATERYLIVAGSGRVRVGSLPATDVGPGDIVFIPPGVPQEIANTGRDDLIFYCLCTPAFDAGDYRRVTRHVPDDDHE